MQIATCYTVTTSDKSNLYNTDLTSYSVYDIRCYGENEQDIYNIWFPSLTQCYYNLYTKM